MKHYPPKFAGFPASLAIVVPPFYPVPGRARADGWVPVRQAEFIGWLAETRSVGEAARQVEMARETAYRLRRRKWSASFCAAWDAAMGLKSLQTSESHQGRGDHEGRNGHNTKATPAELEWRIECGVWDIVMQGGCYAGARRKPCYSSLSQLREVLESEHSAERPASRAGEKSQVL